MMLRLDEARQLVQSLVDEDERAFVELAMKAALVDVRAGANTDFDYVSFVDTMRQLYRKRTIVQAVFNGEGHQHRWWDDV